jgi:uncharacterized protein YbgA (DUF1722 family)
VAHSTELPLEELSARYEKLLTTAMELTATPAQNADVLLRALGLLERYMSPDERQDALDVIEEHRGGRAPLATPMGLLGRHIRTYAVEDLATQSCFAAHPNELRLRDRC